MVRTTEQRIAELEAKIALIKQRDERRTQRKRPEIRHMGQALRSLDQALNATDDSVLRKALDEARTTVSSSLSLLGVTPKAAKPRKVLGANARRKPGGKLDPEGVLTYVRNNPGQKGEDLAAAFATDTANLRPILKALIADGKVRTEGERRGMRYFANGVGTPAGSEGTRIISGRA